MGFGIRYRAMALLAAVAVASVLSAPAAALAGGTVGVPATPRTPAPVEVAHVYAVPATGMLDSGAAKKALEKAGFRVKILPASGVGYRNFVKAQSVPALPGVTIKHGKSASGQYARKGATVSIRCWASWPHGFPTKARSDKFWEPLVKRTFRERGVWTSDNRRHALSTIWGESRGNPYATNGSHFGLTQMTRAWGLHGGVRGDNMPYAQLRAMAKSVKVSHSNWRKHWAATAFRF